MKRAVLIGVGATAFMDAGAEVIKRTTGVAPLNYGLVGRWLGHMRHWQFTHDSIAAAEPVPDEQALGLLVFLADEPRPEGAPEGNAFPSEASLADLLEEAGFQVVEQADLADFPEAPLSWSERIDQVEADRQNKTDPAAGESQRDGGGKRAKSGENEDRPSAAETRPERGEGRARGGQRKGEQLKQKTTRKRIKTRKAGCQEQN